MRTAEIYSALSRCRPAIEWLSGLTGAFSRGLAIGGLTQVESRGRPVSVGRDRAEVDLSKLDEVLIITAL